MKRIIALILVITLFLGLSPAVQALPTGQPRSFTVTETLVNPLYPEFRDEAVPAVVTPVDRPYRPDAKSKTYVALEEAAAQLEAAMEKRQEVIYLYVDDPRFVSASTLFELIGTHTGVPTQGDYINLSYRSYKSSVSYNYIETSSGYYYTYDIKLTMTYYHNADQEKELTAKIKEVLADLKVSSIPDEYHKVRVIYDYLSSHITYLHTYNEEDPYYLLQNSAYSALVDGKAVCQGISTLFYRMLLEAGIENRLISGYVWTGAHGWNIVKIGDRYYNTDLTNDLGREEYRYFLRSEEFFESHTRDDEFNTLSFKLHHPMAKEDYLLKHSLADRPWKTALKPTCTEIGIRTRFCLYCNVSEQEQIPALGHLEEYQIIPPTCEDGGTIIYTCERCDMHIELPGESQLGHDYVLEILQEPDEQTDGHTRETCRRCGYISDYFVEKHKHAYTKTVIHEPQLCTIGGYTADHCEYCYVERRYDFVEPTGHSWYGTSCYRCDSNRPIPFRDIQFKDFFFYPVMWAVDQGITSGTSKYYFSPNAACQRAQVVTFLWRAAGQPDPTGTHNPFVDVKETDFYYKAVLWAVEKGITNGLDRTHFGPFEACNRAQVVTFLHRAMEQPQPTGTTHPFTDVDASAFYYTPMLWAVEKGITNGLSATTFGPNAVCNRAQIVTFLYRAYE